jgi:hypothetical protein
MILYSTYNFVVGFTLFLIIYSIAPNLALTAQLLLFTSISFFSVLSNMMVIFMPKIYRHFMDGLVRRELPIHAAFLSGKDSEKILTLLKQDDVAESAKIRDLEDRTALTLAIEAGIENQEVMCELLVRSLPFDPDTAEPVDPDDHDYAWTRVIQKDKYAGIVREILRRHSSTLSILALAEAEDEDGRAAKDIAGPECKRLIMKELYFYRRYDITTLKSPLHQTANCTGKMIGKQARRSSSC